MMNNFLIAVCLICVVQIVPFSKCYSSAKEELRCGETTVYNAANRRVRRVVGGGPAPKGAWPWQIIVAERRVNVVETLTNGLVGGGTLINKEWILTSASLMDLLLADARRLRVNVSETLILALGYNDLPSMSSFNNEDGVLFKPETVIVHPQFNISRNWDYDIALIKLGRRVFLQGDLMVDSEPAIGGSVDFTPYIRPVCLPCTGTCVRPDDVVDGYGNQLITEHMTIEEACNIEGAWLSGRYSSSNDLEAVITGFGHESFSKPYSRPKTLKQARVNIQPQFICELFFRGEASDYTPRMMCAGGGDNEEPTDACSGDTGNGLVKEIYNSEGRRCWVEVGIVSFGYGCATPFGSTTIPGYYTDVASLSSWIQESLTA